MSIGSAIGNLFRGSDENKKRKKKAGEYHKQADEQVTSATNNQQQYIDGLKNTKASDFYVKREDKVKGIGQDKFKNEFSNQSEFKGLNKYDANTNVAGVTTKGTVTDTQNKVLGGWNDKLNNAGSDIKTAQKIGREQASQKLADIYKARRRTENSGAGVSGVGNAKFDVQRTQGLNNERQQDAQANSEIHKRQVEALRGASGEAQQQKTTDFYQDVTKAQSTDRRHKDNIDLGNVTKQLENTQISRNNQRLIDNLLRSDDIENAAQLTDAQKEDVARDMKREIPLLQSKLETLKASRSKARGDKELAEIEEDIKGITDTINGFGQVLSGVGGAVSEFFLPGTGGLVAGAGNSLFGGNTQIPDTSEAKFRK